MLKYCDDLIGRDRSGKRLFDVVQLPKKGRGLIARVEIPSNTCVLVEDCAFLRTAELMCVKCLKLGHNLASCPAEREVFASLNASFPGCSGLVSQFFCPQPTLQLVLACLEDGGKKVDDHVSRLYRACPKSYCDRICESDFVKLYHICERNTHTMTTVEGMGLFPLLSMLNHSCNPNCTYSCLPGTTRMIVKTTRNMAAGEELLITYIATFLPNGLRQKILSLRYDFTCSCELCSDLAVDRTRAFCCGSGCEGVVCPLGRGDGVWNCMACQRQPSVSEISKMIAAEVYPQLHTKILWNCKDPAMFLSWDKLKSKQPLSYLHWMIYFGHSEKLKLNGEIVACRMLVALFWRHGNPRFLFVDDLVSLLSILRLSSSSPGVREDAAKLIETIGIVLQSNDESNREKECEELIYNRIWDHAKKIATTKQL